MSVYMQSAIRTALHIVVFVIQCKDQLDTPSIEWKLITRGDGKTGIILYIK